MATRKRALVVVESPTKVKTIQKYLDSKFIVKASMGHVRDLPKSALSVDPKKGFKPKYVVASGKKKILDDLKKAAERAEILYVATDPDREGEAIGWHLAQELPFEKKNIYRALGDLVEGDAVDILLVDVELLGQVPADRFTLAVGVRRHVESVGLQGRLLQLVEDLLLAR